ncbi:hypothetical protein U9M48_033621 [Paspalum notatum var. saurae]|uniref:Uncharacterized protein n=1 Tax=Paspalum notatum var. saurae TaxID=547442 RepID=A0AAQ3X6M8_PASNO
MAVRLFRAAWHGAGPRSFFVRAAGRFASKRRLDKSGQLVKSADAWRRPSAPDRPGLRSVAAALIVSGIELHCFRLGKGNKGQMRRERSQFGSQEK